MNKYVWYTNWGNKFSKHQQIKVSVKKSVNNKFD